MVKLLLERGADPNQIYQGNSPWQNALSLAFTNVPSPIRDKEEYDLVIEWVEIFKLFIRHGANGRLVAYIVQKIKR